MMVIVRWGLTAILGGMALLVDVGNATAPILARRRRKNVSMVPLFGAIFGTIACLLCPLGGSAKFIPIAVLCDLSVMSLVAFGVARMFGRSPR
jgi:hypothetical protein